MQKADLAAEIRKVIADEKMTKTQLYRAGLLTGLREAEAKARAFREQWNCAGGFGGHSAAARIIADTLAARIAAIETEDGK